MELKSRVSSSIFDWLIFMLNILENAHWDPGKVHAKSLNLITFYTCKPWSTLFYIRYNCIDIFLVFFYIMPLWNLIHNTTSDYIHQTCNYICNQLIAYWKVQSLQTLALLTSHENLVLPELWYDPTFIYLQQKYFGYHGRLL